MKRIELDLSLPCAREPHKGHNRWHPDIPPALEVDQGEEVLLQTRDALDGQVGPHSTSADLAGADLSVVHPLTGPVYINGALPGDLLEVEVLSVEPASWGFTCIIPGFGFLRDLFPEPFLVRWQIRDGYAESPDLPGVRIPGAPFMGTIGVAPSADLLQEVARREAELLHRGGMVMPPDPRGAVPAVEPIASQGLRTIPPRENGGNLDIKQLTAGTRLFLPVFVKGALFSVGDAHFAQGDSECCGTAIEMPAQARLRFRVHPEGAARRHIRFPFFTREGETPGREVATPGRYLATTGMCISNGRNESEDITLAARQALLNMLQMLEERGWSRPQAYCICSVAVDLRVSEAVDVPNPVVTAFLPLDIFM